MSRVATCEPRDCGRVFGQRRLTGPRRARVDEQAGGDRSAPIAGTRRIHARHMTVPVFRVRLRERSGPLTIQVPRFLLEWGGLLWADRPCPRSENECETIAEAMNSGSLVVYYFGNPACRPALRVFFPRITGSHGSLRCMKESNFYCQSAMRLKRRDLEWNDPWWYNYFAS